MAEDGAHGQHVPVSAGVAKLTEAQSDRRRATAWLKDEPFGLEFAAIHVTDEHMTARGVAMGSAPVSYRLDYELDTGRGFVTTRLSVTSRGEGWLRALGSVSRGRSWTIAADEEGHRVLPPAGGDAAPLAAPSTAISACRR